MRFFFKGGSGPGGEGKGHGPLSPKAVPSLESIKFFHYISCLGQNII